MRRALAATATVVGLLLSSGCGGASDDPAPGPDRDAQAATSSLPASASTSVTSSSTTQPSAEHGAAGAVQIRILAASLPADAVSGEPAPDDLAPASGPYRWRPDERWLTALRAERCPEREALLASGADQPPAEAAALVCGVDGRKYLLLPAGFVGQVGDVTYPSSSTAFRSAVDVDLETDDPDALARVTGAVAIDNGMTGSVVVVVDGVAVLRSRVSQPLLRPEMTVTFPDSDQAREVYHWLAP